MFKNRISSYIILISILISIFSFIGIYLTNYIISWNDGHLYEMSISHIIIFGMILGHHLFLLGIKRASESRDISIDHLLEMKKMVDEKIRLNR